LRPGPSGTARPAAHPEIFVLLLDVADDPALAPLLKGGAAYARELMLAVGRAADGIIVSSRRRLLAHLRAGDGDGVALEMERHLRGLHYMWRLARCRHETGGRDRTGPGSAAAIEGVLQPITVVGMRVDHRNGAPSAHLVTAADGSSRTAAVHNILNADAAKLVYGVTSSDRALRQQVGGADVNVEDDAVVGVVAARTVSDPCPL
jgi:hypothetical protein